MRPLWQKNGGQLAPAPPGHFCQLDARQPEACEAEMKPAAKPKLYRSVNRHALFADFPWTPHARTFAKSDIAG